MAARSVWRGATGQARKLPGQARDVTPSGSRCPWLITSGQVDYPATRGLPVKHPACLLVTGTGQHSVRWQANIEIHVLRPGTSRGLAGAGGVATAPVPGCPGVAPGPRHLGTLHGYLPEPGCRWAWCDPPHQPHRPGRLAVMDSPWPPEAPRGLAVG
jgi:hypothetical protein